MNKTVIEFNNLNHYYAFKYMFPVNTTIVSSLDTVLRMTKVCNFRKVNIYRTLHMSVLNYRVLCEESDRTLFAYSLTYKNDLF